MILQIGLIYRQILDFPEGSLMEQLGLERQAKRRTTWGLNPMINVKWNSWD